ncbi:MAG: hypothetical protein RL385_5866 [Pseudomonadota bacterium]|jgi:hypothetical protein
MGNKRGKLHGSVLGIAGVWISSACSDALREPLGAAAPVAMSDADASGPASQVQTQDAETLPTMPAAPVAPEAGAQTTAGDAASLGMPVHVPLISSRKWARVKPELDPFTDRPTSVVCEDGATMAEPLSGVDVFSVDTGTCNYITIGQVTLADIAPGDTLLARIWHFELNAPEPAEAHVAVHIDGVALVDERVPIPQAGGLIVRQMKAERAIAAGSPVYFHLHNHGANSWAITEVSKLLP